MLLHDARKAARTTSQGDLVTLEEQDRNLWDAAVIAEGLALLDRASAFERRGVYLIQAAIAAQHDRAPTAAQTDWRTIAALYTELYSLTGSPVIALNRAAAIGMAQGPEAGLQEIARIESSGALDRYHLLFAAKADLFRRARRFADAIPEYAKAIELTGNIRERRYLERRQRECFDSESPRK
jgi:RNA polymerase sigma-70 factor (ECF subfamily)